MLAKIKSVIGAARLFNIIINILRTGDESRERGNAEDKQEHKPATKTSGTGKRARGSKKPIGPTPRKAGVGGTSNQGEGARSAEPHRETIKITNHNRDSVKALNEPLTTMSTAPLRSPGGDHLVETGLVIRG